MENRNKEISSVHKTDENKMPTLVVFVIFLLLRVATGREMTWRNVILSQGN